jgi:tRNA (guanosine-2'-O-)-methyltransferase
VRGPSREALSRVAVAVAFVACGGATPAPAIPDVTPRRIEAPEDAALDTACTPTGPELCFNAIDDNCNGVIDEGCGVNTGVLQFAIAWDEATANVDLAVVDPDGARVDARNPTRGQLHLDRRCPVTGAAGGSAVAETCGGQNTENVYADVPTHGVYTVEVRLVDAGGAHTPLTVQFSARVGSHPTWHTRLSLSPGDERSDRRSFKFEL